MQSGCLITLNRGAGIPGGAVTHCPLQIAGHPGFPPSFTEYHCDVKGMQPEFYLIKK